MIGIICARDCQDDRFKLAMQEPQIKTIGGVEYISGHLCSQEVVMAFCPYGKVYGAMCAQTMLLTYGVQMLLCFGMANALVQGFSQGDILLASEVAQHDVDCSAIGKVAGSIEGVNKIYLKTSERITEKLEYCIKTLDNINYKIGPLASGDQFVCNEETKAAIEDTFGAFACDMEAGAIGQVCYLNDVGFAVVKVIGYSMSSAGSMDYQKAIQMAKEVFCTITERFLYSWN